MKSIKPEITRTFSPAIEGKAMTKPAINDGSRRGKFMARRAAVAVGLSGILVGMSAGFAAAATPDATVNQSITSNQNTILEQGEGKQFGTWLFGRTVICFKNLGPQVASYKWISSSSFGSRSLAPYQRYCESRSFVGFGIYVTNNSATNSSIWVSLPYGP